MKSALTGMRNQWTVVIAALSGVVATAALVIMMPHSASTYVNGEDPNQIILSVNSFQDALDAAMIKCALDRPDCVGTTGGPGGVVDVTTDGTNFALRIQAQGLAPIIAEKIKAKDMQRFRDQIAVANSLSPVPHDNDPNQPVLLSDHTIIQDPDDPNNQIDNSDMRITSTLTMKIKTADGRKGVLKVSVSPSLAVRWDLQLK